MLQVFGITNHSMAKEWSDLLGLRPQDLDQLAREEAVVLRQGQGSLVCRRPDYLKDEVFAGLFDANQRFALQGQRRLKPEQASSTPRPVLTCRIANAVGRLLISRSKG